MSIDTTIGKVIMAKKKKICFFDTNMVIWLFQNNSTDPDIKARHDVVRAEYDDLINEGAVICIAAPTALELLINVTDPKDREEILSLLGNSFHFYPFDLSAAIQGSDAYSLQFAELKNEYKGQPYIRNLLKTDVQIMSTALSRNADFMYSDDKDIKKMEGHGITVKQLGDIIYQAKLPEK